MLIATMDPGTQSRFLASLSAGPIKGPASLLTPTPILGKSLAEIVQMDATPDLALVDDTEENREIRKQTLIPVLFVTDGNPDNTFPQYAKVGNAPSGIIRMRRHTVVLSPNTSEKMDPYDLAMADYHNLQKYYSTLCNISVMAHAGNIVRYLQRKKEAGL